ncbi:hypothetical protein EDC04DRAFT_1021305 [Pisolithus marmoratus]|nr:hypothetical protein EDC04DRAFT_1021305 [Pisolithus marmoratus]
MCRFALLSAPMHYPSHLVSLICRHVFLSHITGLASPFPGRTTYLLPTQLHDCFTYALPYTLPASLALAYNPLMYAMHSLHHLFSTLVSCRFVLFSWCLLFQSSITLKFTFSWPFRGQFSISLGSVLQVLCLCPFQQTFGWRERFLFSHFCSGMFPSFSLVLEARVLSPPPTVYIL